MHCVDTDFTPYNYNKAITEKACKDCMNMILFEKNIEDKLCVVAVSSFCITFCITLYKR